MRCKTHHKTILCLLAIGALCGDLVFAVDSYWKGNSQAWGINGQWSPSGEPGAGDNVFIDTGSGVITLSAGELASSLNVSANGWTLSGGTLQLDSTGTINVDNGLGTPMTFTIGSSLVGTGVNIDKTGNDTLVLTGANTYTGTTTISSGILNIQNSLALGSTSGGTTVSNGGELQLQGGITVAGESLNLYGTGAYGSALRNVSGNNSFNGPVTLSGDTTVSSDSGILTFDPLAGTAFSGAYALTLAGAGDIVINDPIADLSSLTKTGTGTLTLNGNNTYTGVTNVAQGTLILNGSLSGSINLTGGTICGTGNFGDFTLNPGATLSPGTSGTGGKLNVSNTTFLGGTYNLDVLGTSAGTLYDQLNITGSFAFNNDVALTINLGAFDPLDNVNQFVIVNNDGSDLLTGSGLFNFGGNQLSNGEIFTAGIQMFSINYFGGDGNDIVLIAVPEPGSMTMMIGGFAMLLGIQRMRFKRSK